MAGCCSPPRRAPNRGDADIAGCSGGFALPGVVVVQARSVRRRLARLHRSQGGRGAFARRLHRRPRFVPGDLLRHPAIRPRLRLVRHRQRALRSNQRTPRVPPDPGTPRRLLGLRRPGPPGAPFMRAAQPHGRKRLRHHASTVEMSGPHLRGRYRHEARPGDRRALLPGPRDALTEGPGGPAGAGAARLPCPKHRGRRFRCWLDPQRPDCTSCGSRRP